MKPRPYSAIVKLKSEPSELRSRDSISKLMQIHKSQKLPSPPKHIQADQETLYLQNIKCKQETNTIKQENIKLHTTIQKLNKRISLIEKIDKYQTNVDSLGLTIYNTDGSIIPMLKNKIKEQADQITQLTDFMQKQYKSVKLTQLVELQREIKSQQDLILELTQSLQIALNIEDEDLHQQPDILNRIRKYIETIDQQQKQFKILQQQNQILNEKFDELVDDNKKVMDELKNIQFEKIQLKKKLEEQLITETEQYQQKKREFLEKKLQSVLKQVDSLKGELSLYENKYKQSMKQLQEQDRQYKLNIVSAQKAKLHLEEILIKKDQMIQDLQDRVTIYDLLKQKTKNEEQQQPIVKHILPPKTYRDQYTQFPELQLPQHKVTDLINTKPIDKDKLKNLLEDLQYKIISLCLTKIRLQYLFQGIQFIQLKDAVLFFMKHPFNYQEQDSLILCRHFIGEDKGQGYKIQWEDTQNVQDLIQSIIPNKENTEFNYKSILKRNKLIKQINSIIPKIKLEHKIYNVDEYIIKLLNSKIFQTEQITFLRLINQIYLGDVNNIDHTFLCLYLKEECEMMSQLNSLQKIDFTIYRFIPKLRVKDTEEYEDSQPTNLTQQIKPHQDKPYELNETAQSSINPYKQMEFKIDNKYDNLSLKQSEFRKPSKDTLSYSNSCVESIPLIKLPSEYNKMKHTTNDINHLQHKEIVQQDDTFQFYISSGLAKPPSLMKNPDFIQQEQIEEEMFFEEL